MEFSVMLRLNINFVSDVCLNNVPQESQFNLKIQIKPYITHSWFVEIKMYWVGDSRKYS